MDNALTMWYPLLDRFDAGRPTDSADVFAVIAADPDDVDLTHARTSGLDDRLSKWRPGLRHLRARRLPVRLRLLECGQRGGLFRDGFAVSLRSDFKTIGHRRHDPTPRVATHSRPCGRVPRSMLTQTPHEYRLVASSKTAPGGGGTPTGGLDRTPDYTRSRPMADSAIRAVKRPLAPGEQITYPVPGTAAAVTLHRTDDGLTGETVFLV